MSDQRLPPCCQLQYEHWLEVFREMRERIRVLEVKNGQA